MVLSKPVIAAVSGHAVAGGLELALWCDLRVVEEDAVMGVFCRRWGVPLIDGGTVRLPRLIGGSRAMDMILTGRGVAAAEAHAIGLANRVVPKGQARQHAEELAAELAALPQQCMRSDRTSLLHQWGMSESDALDFEFASISRVAAEAMEGSARFAAGAVDVRRRAERSVVDGVADLDLRARRPRGRGGGIGVFARRTAACQSHHGCRQDDGHAANSAGGVPAHTSSLLSP